MDVRISVRDLVEFLMRSGDIDNRHVASSEKAMQEGIKIHKKIQSMQGPGYEAEVPLSHVVTIRPEELKEEEIHLQIDGRADGIFETAGCIFIDEIKSLYRDVNKMKEPVPVHEAQAKCYAYIHALQMGLEEIGVRMTYVSLENENVRYFEEKYAFEEIELWFSQLMEAYEVWLVLRAKWKNMRDASIEGLKFPYAYREGQKELVENVYKTIYHERKLFLEAPTGVGKTLATVYPSVMAIGKQMGDRIFYLTAKTITRTVAMEAFQTLRAQGLQFKTVVITGKEKICANCVEEDGEERTLVACNPEKCPRAKGHFDRINACLYDCLTKEVNITREVVQAYATQYEPTRQALWSGTRRNRASASC